MKKLAQISELLAAVRTLLDGGYHYSSPFLRSRGDAPDLAPPMVREKSDALSLLADIQEDLVSIALSLEQLDEQARVLQLDTKLICGVELSLYKKVYDTLAKDLAVTVKIAVDTLNGESVVKPDRRRGTRVPKASTVKQTNLAIIDDDPPSHEQADLELDIPESA
jgi:hypothetical protein